MASWFPRLVAVDVDGTLLANNITMSGMTEETIAAMIDPEHERPSDRTVAALARMQALGVTVGIATGRDAESTLVLARKIPGMSFVVGGNGARSMRVEDGATIFRQPMGAKATAMARQLIASLRRASPDMPFNVELTDTQGVFGQGAGALLHMRDRPHAHDDMDWTRWKHAVQYHGCTFVADLVEALARPGVFVAGPVYAYAGGGDGKGGPRKGPTVRDIWAAWKETPEGRAQMSSGVVTEGMGLAEPGPVNVTIMDVNPERDTETCMAVTFNGSDKAVALEAFCKERGIRTEDVLVFGNDFNDIGMLGWAGKGVAMAGSPGAVLEAADEVTLPAAQDGIAVYLEALIAQRAGRPPTSKL